MTGIRIANAPCSWGVMMGFAAEGPFPAYTQVLDEMVEARYKGTELGDWGFMPQEAEVLAPEIKRRGLAMVGALVPLALADRASHRDGVETALRTARLLAACARGDANGGPFVVLADENGSDEVRTRYAGRIRPEQGLSAEGWRSFIAGADLRTLPNSARSWGACERTGSLKPPGVMGGRRWYLRWQRSGRIARDGP